MDFELARIRHGATVSPFRFRVGAYRIIFALDHAEHRVIVLHVKHRKDAYHGRD